MSTKDILTTFFYKQADFLLEKKLLTLMKKFKSLIYIFLVIVIASSAIIRGVEIKY